MATGTENTSSPKRKGVFLPSTEELRTLAGTDHVLRFMMDHGIPITREGYISLNWMGETPDPWTHEDEDELPEFLQDEGAVQQETDET
jgi:hypothetical protein